MPRRGLRIGSDPSLLPVEKETCLHLLGGAAMADVHTMHPTAIRGFLAQPEFVVTQLVTASVSGRDTVVGLRGLLPLGCLKVGAARKDGRLSRVFSRRGGRQQLTALCRHDASQMREGPSGGVAGA